MEEIAVRIVIFSNRKTYQLQWSDPKTGKKKTKSSTVARPTTDASTQHYNEALAAAAAEASRLAKQLAHPRQEADFHHRCRGINP